MKKGQFQFNWIFIVVVGALFLFFFVSFAIKYKDFQESKTNTEIINNLDNTLTALQASSFKTFDTLNLPVKITSRCGKLNAEEREVKTKNIIFSPRQLDKKILIWYEPYKLPFKISSFYYIIPDDAKYYFVEDFGTLSSELLENMPEDIRKKFSVIRSSNLKNDGKLIFLDASGFDNKGVKVNGDINQGTVIVNGEEKIYVGRELLYGAIFGDDYSCLLDKIKEETNNVGNVYKSKINVINRVSCNYNLVIDYINNLQSNLDYEIAKDLDEENTRLIGQGCVGVF